MRNDSQLVFKRQKSLDEDYSRMYHAKVWLTTTKMAVGSWNFSRRATGLGISVEERNVEAGIICDSDPKIFEKLTFTLSLLDETHFAGIEPAELEAEWEHTLNPYSYSCSVTADWRTFTYRVEELHRSDNVYLSLPDRPTEKIPMSEVHGASFRDRYKHVLKNKNFLVYDEQEKTIFQGYLVEEHKYVRPAYGYTSLLDLMESLISDPAGESANKRVQYSLEGDDLSEDAEIPLLNYRGNESYYLMFVSFQKLYEKIVESKGNKNLIDKLAFRLPGSLVNIADLVKDSTLMLQSSPENNDSLLFHWFMTAELNRCIVLMNTYLPELNAIEPMDSSGLLEQAGAGNQDLQFARKLSQLFEYAT